MGINRYNQRNPFELEGRADMNSYLKGHQFQNKIREKLESITSKYRWCKTLSEPRIQGKSNILKLDLVVAAEKVITGGHLYLAMIECKGPGRNPSPPVYWSLMSKAYTKLNDLRLQRAKGCHSFYLLVNRRPVKGESPRLDYPQLFKCIGVELVHEDDPKELAVFEEQMDRLCRENSPVRQLKEMSLDEKAKFPPEVWKKARERALKEIDRLKLLGLEELAS